jgi:hypothetical protein
MKAMNDRQGGGRIGVAAIFGAAARLGVVALLLVGCDECDTDTDCQAGQVCESVPVPDQGNDNQCVTGCHDDSQCGVGQRCEPVVCVTAPCPGQCVGATNECRGDADCASGSVCELSTGCEEPSRCVPGCHEDSQCSSGDRCRVVQCFTCPCPGFCEADVGACDVDSDCDAGSVCELSTGCEQPSQCVPGCHDDSMCPRGQHCEQPQCLTCPCPGFCAP